MATVPCDPIDKAREMDAFCRWAIRAAWHLSLLWGGLVALLSWTAGAGLETAIIRGLVTYVVLGLLGWGANAVMVQGGQQQDAGSAAEAQQGIAPEWPAGVQAAQTPAATAGAAEPTENMSEAPVGAEDGVALAAEQEGGDALDYLAEAAS